MGVSSSAAGADDEIDTADAEYRRIVEDRRALCSAEWRRHVHCMEQPGAGTDEAIQDPALQALAVANLRQLQDLEDRAAAGEGGLMPTSEAASFYFLRSLQAGIRGMRVPERLAGDVWLVGWCGRPCPAGAQCISPIGRCLRPVVVRRGHGFRAGDLEAHEHHWCVECHRASRGRRY